MSSIGPQIAIIGYCFGGTMALEAARAGEDLVAITTGPKVRLLGAVRNMSACVECHGGKRGDLLGAFSYRLAEAK